MMGLPHEILNGQTPSITASYLAAGSVEASEIAAGAVDTSELATDSVRRDKVLGGTATGTLGQYKKVTFSGGAKTVTFTGYGVNSIGLMNCDTSFKIGMTGVPSGSTVTLIGKILTGTAAGAAYKGASNSTASFYAVVL